MKYIENNEAFGIEYDWRLIEKEYNKLGVPELFYRPPFQAIPRNKYFIGLSDRSTGKTTNWLLLGLVMNKLYGTIVQYVRETNDELSPSHAEKLVEVVRAYNQGEYIRKLTNGRYNSIYYHWRGFFYCLVDESGKRVEVADKEIIHCLSIEDHEEYKSTYNAPLGDFVLLDEFIRKSYRPNVAIDFLDLTKTIFRDRLSPIVVMTANTIKLSSIYFEEFEISRQVLGMKKGEFRQCVTEKGTKLFVEIIDAAITRSAVRKRMNELFYGFKNPRINAITGESLYAFESVPHIPPKDETFYKIENRIYVETGIDLLQMEYCYNDALGYHFQIHRATRTYDDSIVLSLDVVQDHRYLWGFGTPKLQRAIGKAIAERRVYFSSNEVGTTFNDYVRRYQALKNKV